MASHHPPTAPGPIDAFGRIRAWIGTARLAPGDKLPPERALSETLGLSRTELRKGLAVMELNGELERRVGRGTFLRAATGPGEAAATALPAVPDLSARTSPHSAMMARMAVEPQVTGLAALHATPQQLAALAELAAAMRTAPTWDAYEALDARFHDAIGIASGNTLLAEIQRLLNAVRVAVVWSRLDQPAGGPPADYPSFAEHDTILAALESRDRAAAQDAMRAHLKSIRARLLPED